MIVTVVASAGVLKTPLVAQNRAAGAAFTLEHVLDYPFPDNLTASPNGSAVAWTFNERGARNIYIATAPDFTARRVTPYQSDDGQELTNLRSRPTGRPSCTCGAAITDRTGRPKAT